MEVENIILSKQYFELTPSELAQVSELVSNELEFDDMKAFLLSTQSVFETQKITETPELDDKILAQLNASAATNQTWYNSFLLFLFPRDRPLYQYPAFQLTLVSVLVFGAFNLINFDSLNGDTMAYEDVAKVEVENDGLGGAEKTEEETILEYEEMESPTVTTVENNDKVLSGEDLPGKNTLDTKSEVSSELDFIAPVMEDADLEEELADEVVLMEESEANTQKDFDLTNNNTSSSYKDVEMEKDNVNQAPATTNGVTTIANTESRTDRSLKLDKEKNKSNAKKEMPASVSDTYANNIEGSNEQSIGESKVTARTASMNLTPELKQLFFEVK